MHRALATVLVTIMITLTCLTGAAFGASDDWDLSSGGHFFSQTGGGAGLGYSITDDAGVAFWSEFKRLGGVQAVGYPVSERFEWNGTTCQAMQKVIFQWHPESNSVQFANLFDFFHEQGKDDWLLNTWLIPQPVSDDYFSDLGWDQIVDYSLGFLDANRAIYEAYYSVPGDPVTMNGLPTSEVTDMGDCYTLRCQCVVFQQWKRDMPWAKSGQVTMANGGVLASQVGPVPSEAAQAKAPISGPVSSPVTGPAPTATNQSNVTSQSAPPVAQGEIGSTITAAVPSAQISQGNSDKIELLSMFGSYTAPLGSIKFSADGRILAIGTQGAAEVIDRASGNVVYRLEDAENNPINVDISADSHLLAVGSRHEIKLLETTTYGVVMTIANPDGLPNPHFSADGKFIMAKTKDNRVKVWETISGREVVTIPPEGSDISFTQVPDVAISPDGSMLATVSDDNNVRIWQVADGQLVWTLQSPTSDVFSVAFSPDGGLLAAGELNGTIRTWDVATGQAVNTLAGHTGKVVALAFSSDSHLLLSGAEDWSARLWDVNGGSQLRQFDHGEAVDSVAFSADSQLLATGNNEGKVRLWGIR